MKFQPPLDNNFCFLIHQPYVCDRCNKACSSSTYLKKHKKTCRQDCEENVTAQEEYIEITSIPTTLDPAMPDSNAIILTEVAENSETFYVRIDGIHEIMDATAINEHSLVDMSRSEGVEILGDMIEQEENNIRMHIDEKNVYQTIDHACIQAEQPVVVVVNDGGGDVTDKENSQYFMTSDCVLNK